MISLLNDYSLSDKQEDMQLNVIYNFLTHSYWAKNIGIDIVKKSIEFSLCVGVFKNSKQVGFARLISDQATYAYLADVFVLPDHRKQGLAKEMISHFQNNEELTSIRRWMLVTADSQPLYESIGWETISEPYKFMQRYNADIYL